jgi:hypothetical protein
VLNADKKKFLTEENNGGARTKVRGLLDAISGRGENIALHKELLRRDL